MTERLTVQMVAEELEVSIKTVRRWIRHGKLPAEKWGRGVRIRRPSLYEFKKNYLDVLTEK